METIDFETKLDLNYLIERRDDALDHFNDLIKQYGLYNDEQLHKSLDTVLRICKQVKLAEDTLILYNLAKNNNK
jgi:uncharacterized protein Yka (UPF0111/DUF47 family)